MGFQNSSHIKGILFKLCNLTEKLTSNWNAINTYVVGNIYVMRRGTILKKFMNCYCTYPVGIQHLCGLYWGQSHTYRVEKGRSFVNCCRSLYHITNGRFDVYCRPTLRLFGKKIFICILVFRQLSAKIWKKHEYIQITILFLLGCIPYWRNNVSIWYRIFLFWFHTLGRLQYGFFEQCIQCKVHFEISRPFQHWEWVDQSFLVFFTNKST